MTELAQEALPAPQPTLSKTDIEQAAEIQSHLRRIDRKQWWMWSSAFMVTMLLALTVASFAFPALLRQGDTGSFFLSQSVRALIGLVLLFNVYMVYQQLQITRLRGQLSDQIRSMAKMQVLTAEVYKLAALDQLTGLYNRRSGEQRLLEEMSRAQRHGRPLTVLMLDVDHLKDVNDKYGHGCGDTLLKAFSSRLKRAIRGSDLAVRLGGDEFMVLLPECKPDEVNHVLSRLGGIEVDYDGETFIASFSSGWTEMQDGDTPDQFLRRADDALYASKRSGRKSAETKIPMSEIAH